VRVVAVHQCPVDVEDHGPFIHAAKLMTGKGGRQPGRWRRAPVGSNHLRADAVISFTTRIRLILSEVAS